MQILQVKYGCNTKIEDFLFLNVSMTKTNSVFELIKNIRIILDVNVAWN